MSNARVARVLVRDRIQTLKSMQVMNDVIDVHASIGLIGAAQLVNKTLARSQQGGRGPFSLVEQRSLNTLIPKLVMYSSLLPSNLAVTFWNNLMTIDDGRARHVLADIQDRWFEGWKDSALEGSTKRPKKKLEVTGLYSAEKAVVSNARIPRCPFIESLEDDVLENAVRWMKEAYNRDPKNMEHLQLIVRAFVKEYRSRALKTQKDIDSHILEFINSLEQKN